MKIKLNRIFLCLLAAMAALQTGAVPVSAAEGDTAAAEVSPEETEEEEEAAPASESIELSEKEAKRLLVRVGTAGDYDLYKAGDDFEERIWDMHGGKPEKKAQLTDKQKAEKEAAEADIKTVKKLGKLVLVDRDTSRAAASFDKSIKCEEGLRFLSESGKYLLTMDKDMTKALKLVRAVSVTDDPHLFRNEGSKALELMSPDMKEKIREYRGGRKKDGKLWYTADDGSFAWLSLSGDHVIGTFRYAAENDSFRMLVDDRLANIGIENRKTGYIWWSAPLGASSDSKATPLLRSELRSSAVLRYGIPSKRNNNNYLRSAADECRITVKDIKNGIRAEYEYSREGFSFPVEYTLEDDHLKASLIVSDIKETNAANIATEITLLGSFGAASPDEKGCFVIPDGCGALIDFETEGITDPAAYSQPVYGRDVTAVPTARGAVTEQIYLPVYGIVKEDNALLAIASKGDSNAVLTAAVSGQSGSSYDICSFTFVLRGADTYYMSGKLSDKLTVFENGGIKSDNIEVRYYPISGKDVDYTDIAARYRKYLTDEAGVMPRTAEGEAPFHIALYGGVQKKKPVLGVPVTMRQKVTGYADAQEILSSLHDAGVSSMNVTYDNWTDDGIDSKVDTGAKASGTLGGSRALSSLQSYAEDNGIGLYPVSDDMTYYPGNGYNSFSGSSVRISGAYSRIVSYDRAYGVPDGVRKNLSLLSPSCFTEVYTGAAESWSAAGFDGISPGGLASVLYGDYGKEPVSRFGAMTEQKESLEKMDDSLEGGVLARGANAYAFPYLSGITDVPLSSSQFDVFSEDVPFLQTVLHGLIPCYTEAVNGSPDPDTLLLKAAATGCLPSYDLLSAEISVLKDTEYDRYYYAGSEMQIDRIADTFRQLSPLLREISTQTITDCRTEKDGKRIITEYSGGTSVAADLDEMSLEWNGRKLLSGGKKEGGD